MPKHYALVVPDAAVGTAANERLVRDCLLGDERAWARLIRKYENLIYSVPLKYGLAGEDAADVFQAVCLELYRELPRLRSSDSLSSWLTTVATHQAFRLKRKRQRRAQNEVPTSDGVDFGAATLLPAIMEQVEKEQRLRDGIARLPPRCQELVRLLFYEQPARPYAEVARQMGLATGSIGFIRGRCLKRLQRILEELGF